MKQGWASDRGITLILLSICFVALSASLGSSFTIGPNYRNISVDTTVNITNAQPEILKILNTDPITLNAGDLTRVECNVTVRDYNGGSDVDTLNATFFHSTSEWNASDDNNTHYTNSSCTNVATGDVYANFTCTFDVLYHALPGTWNCTVFVNDTQSFTVNRSNSTTINELYALNVTPLIDYGNLAVLDTSANETANITNLGNVAINVSVYGYGNETNDGLAMICDQRNISIMNQRYSSNITHLFNQKSKLNESGVLIPNLTIAKQTAVSTPIVETTFWQLFINQTDNPFGRCNGTIVFQAEASS